MGIMKILFDNTWKKLEFKGNKDLEYSIIEKMYSEIFETELKIKNGKLEPKIALNILATKLCIKK